MLISLIKSYISNEYKNIPIGNIIVIVSALIYFVSPIDLIPDNIPGIGHIDDAAVLWLVWKMAEDDVEEYKKWQIENDKRIFR